MPPPYAIFLCDETGIMAAPWAAAGVICYLVDPAHPPGITRKGNIIQLGGVIAPDLNLPEYDHCLDFIGNLIRSGRVIFVGGFPPCTDLAGSGARHWQGKFTRDRYFQAKAALILEQCRTIGTLSGAPWFFENPRGAASGIMGPPNFSFNPCDFGGYLPEDDEHPLWPDYLPPRDAYPKETFIWAGSGFIRPDPKPVDALDYYPGWKKLGGKSRRTKKIRSATPRGWAQAVFEANYKLRIAA